MPLTPSTAPRHRRAVLPLALLGVMLGCGDVDDAPGPTGSNDTPTLVRGGSVAIPTVEGPISGGRGAPFIASTAFDLAQVGYSEAEYFISGTAAAYTRVGTLSADGMWTVTPRDTAAYKTLILVYRPIEL